MNYDKIKTMCCKAPYKIAGRAYFVCEKCGEDVTLEILLMAKFEHENKKR